MINLIKNIVEIYKIHLEKDKKVIEKREHLALRNENFPTCTLANNCNIIDTQLGTHVVVHGGVKLKCCTVGRRTYFAPNSIINNATIQSFCSIGNNVKIGLSRHPSSVFVSTYPAFFSRDNEGCKETFITQNKYDESPKLTEICNDVWIGNNVIIPGGIHIGNGAIIAAGSVLTKDVLPYAIMGGNPATLIRHRFNKSEIKVLLDIQWWDFEDDKLLKYADYFPDISLFLEKILDQQNQKKL